jgi:anti-sigma factor ChrR (cupin superfamily)
VPHLSDVACLEWIRHRAVALAPETTMGVATHLEGCEECRRRVAGFEALERSFHAFGAPMRRPRALVAGRWILRTGVVAAVVAAALGALAIVA